jgi:hypothetical protein
MFEAAAQGQVDRAQAANSQSRSGHAGNSQLELGREYNVAGDVPAK